MAMKNAKEARGTESKFDASKREYMKLSFGEMKRLAREISRIILAEYGKPGSIVYIERGGMVFARMLSDFLSVKELHGINASYYTDIGTPSSKVNVGSAEIRFSSKGYVLVADDIADTGKTLGAVLGKLSKSTNKRLVSATLVFKPASATVPDIYGKKVSNETWIVFDYEENETVQSFVRSGNENGLRFMKKNF